MAQIIVLGAGIVGVSTSIWLQRAGYRVTLIDKVGPASGTSFGNAGVLAAGGVIPVTTPGLWKKAPFMLLDKNSPLFLRWRYLPKLAPFLVAAALGCIPTTLRPRFTDTAESLAARIAGSDFLDEAHVLRGGNGKRKRGA